MWSSRVKRAEHLHTNFKGLSKIRQEEEEEEEERIKEDVVLKKEQHPGTPTST